MAKQLFSDGVRFVVAKIVAERQAKITQNDLGDFVAHSSEASGFVCLLLELSICTADDVVPFRHKLASNEAFTCSFNVSALHIKSSVLHEIRCCGSISQPGIKRKSHGTH